MKHFFLTIPIIAAAVFGFLPSKALSDNAFENNVNRLFAPERGLQVISYMKSPAGSVFVLKTTAGGSDILKFQQMAGKDPFVTLNRQVVSPLEIKQLLVNIQPEVMSLLNKTLASLLSKLEYSVDVFSSFEEIRRISPRTADETPRISDEDFPRLIHRLKESQLVGFKNSDSIVTKNFTLIFSTQDKGPLEVSFDVLGRRDNKNGIVGLEVSDSRGGLSGIMGFKEDEANMKLLISTLSEILHQQLVRENCQNIVDPGQALTGPRQ